MASISCRCGKVKLQFSTKTARVSTECCCNHCFDRVQYLERLGGPCVDMKKPVLATKWDNKVKILSGEECLFAYKLTSTTLVTNIASRCCHTFLLGRHSGYDANCVTTSSDFPIFENVARTNDDDDDDQSFFIPSSRWFSNQWDEQRMKRIKENDPYNLIGIWVNESDGKLDGEDGWQTVLKKHMECIQRPIVDDDDDDDNEVKGKSFDEIIDQYIGRNNIIIVSEQQD